MKIGPSGMAYVGQFQNSISILSMLATCAIASGVIKYLSTYREDRELQQKVITNSMNIVLISSVIISLFIIPASVFLSKAAFHTTEFWSVYMLYGIFLCIISLNSLFAAFLNGFKEIRRFTIINVISALCNILFTVTFAYTLGVKGVLVASVFVGICVFGINVYFVKKINGFKWRPDFKKFDPKMSRMLLAFTLMGLISGFANPAMQLIVRDKIISDFSALDAGCWQAVTRISDFYLAFITTVLGVYYLPRLSEIHTKDELRKEIIKGYKLILPVVGALAFLIWLCKVWVVHILFTEEFLPMLPLFKFQLLGDFLKIGSWLLGFIMISKALTKTFIISEILFSCSFVILSFFFMEHYGVIGTTYAFCLNYALYWIGMWFLMKKYIV